VSELSYQKIDSEISVTDLQSRLAEGLQSAPIISSCQPAQIARILPKVTFKNLDSGDNLFSIGDPADNLYLIIRGNVRLDDGSKDLCHLSYGFVGEETVVDAPGYISNATVNSPTMVIIIPKGSIEILLENNPNIKSEFNMSLLNRYLKKKKSKVEVTEAGNIDSRKSNQGLIQSIGWVLTILLPILIFSLEKYSVFDHLTNTFIAIFFIITIMSVFDLKALFIPGMLSILMLTSLHIVPPSLALSGFTSDYFFMGMSIFGLSAVMLKSGIIYRFLLFTLKYVPPYKIAYPFYIFLMGLFFTPIIPSTSGTVGIMAPIFKNMVEALGYKKGEKAATQLAVATFIGITAFGSAFITGKATNLIVFGMLPLQVREQFTSAYWVFASLIYLLVTFILNLAFIFILYRNKEIPVLSKEQIEVQLKILGPLSKREWEALVGIIIFIVGVITTSIHNIGASWIAYGVLMIFLALESLSQKEFESEINWSFLICGATMIGVAKTISYLGLDQWIGNQIAWMSSYMQTNFVIFLALLSVGIFLMRFIISTSTIVIILSAIFIPLSQLYGINPWIVGFIILNLSDLFILPFQSGAYFNFTELCQDKEIFNQKSMLAFNALSCIFKVLALFASIPFWKWLGLL